MRIRILMVGNNIADDSADTEVLRDRGFMVYTCKENSVDEMVGEIKPDVIFINSDQPECAHSTKVYNDLLDNVQYASYPIIYTLLEDDVYLVNRKRTASKDKRTVISDNMVDSVKTALINPNTTYTKTKRVNINTKNLPLPLYANRA